MKALDDNEIKQLSKSARELYDENIELKSQLEKEGKFTLEAMEKCFEAGCKFGRDMFINPSNSEYISNLKN